MSRPKGVKDALPGLRRILFHFWPHIRKQRWLIAGSLLALFAEVGMRLVEPWPLKLVLDRVIVGAPAGGSTGIPALDALDPMTLLTVAAVAVVVATGLRALADFLSTIGFSLVGNRVLTEVRGELYRHLQGLSLSFHTKARSGDLIVRITHDTSQLQDMAATAILPLLADVLILFGMLGVMFWLNWQLALLAMAVVPLFWLSTVRLSSRIRETAREQRRRQSAMAATAAESIVGIRSVQALGLEGVFAGAFSRQNNRSLREGVKTARLSAGLQRSVDVLLGIATALVLWYGARLVIAGALTPGDLVVFLAYLKSAFRPVRDFAKYSGRLAKATASGERVLDILERTPEVRNRPGAVPAPHLAGAVRFEGVSFAYEPGHPVLSEVEFEARPGQHVAIVGPSGAGKSTLTALLLRLYDPTEGRVLMDGRDVREYTLESLRGQIGVILQDTVLFAASVRENIGYGRPEASEEEIEAAARLANAHEFIQALPEGYDTILGERGASLSNGQRQRIAVARAALRRASILIMDEPTTGLDQLNQRVVARALEDLADGRTAFLITHDATHAARSDLILYLEGGRVLEQGSHAELMRAGGRYARLHRSRAAVSDLGTQEDTVASTG